MATRPQIGIFGRRNAGKSSLINVLCGQEVAIVSDVPGTTTDPVRKIMEIPGIGPIVLVDTAGMDDRGLLGEKRVLKSKEVIMQINLAILLFSGNFIGEYERNLIADFKQQRVPFFLLHNMSDRVALHPEVATEVMHQYGTDVLDFTCKEPYNLNSLIDLIKKHLGPSPFQTVPMLEGLVEANDRVVLVCPVDSEAPEGRLILPQVQAIREVLDKRAVALVMQETQLVPYFERLRHAPAEDKPVLVITDSQLFGKVEQLVPQDQPLTGFSLLLARSKGAFQAYLEGTPAIDRLQDGDRVLLLEACSHHSTCDDIGRVKLPRLLRRYTGKQLEFDVVSGLDMPSRPFSDYALVIQCGGCMITQRQVMNRAGEAVRAGVPVTNYGMALAYTNGIYKRAVAPLLS